MNHYGLSKKTNVALAAITGITVAAEHWPAIIAIGILAVYCVTLQFKIDRSKKCVE